MIVWQTVWQQELGDSSPSDCKQVKGGTVLTLWKVCSPEGGLDVGWEGAEESVDWKVRTVESYYKHYNSPFPT